MKLAGVFAAVTMFGAGLLIGCDDKPTLPPGYSEGSDNKPSADARPTTQELLSGPFKRLSLAPLPLSANVPASWSVKMMTDNLYFLQGPSPSAEVQVQIAERTSETAEKLDRMLRAAKRDADAHKDTMRVEVRALGDMKVLDMQRDVTHAPPPGTPGATTAPTVPMKYVDWSVTYYVPRGSDYAAYELHFFNLSADVFNADRGFLQRILDSVSPEHAGLGVTPDSGSTGPR